MVDYVGDTVLPVSFHVTVAETAFVGAASRGNEGDRRTVRGNFSDDTLPVELPDIVRCKTLDNSKYGFGVLVQVHEVIGRQWDFINVFNLGAREFLWIFPSAFNDIPKISFQPFPETPIWEYIEKNNLIPDVEKYLDEVAERGGSQIINLTKVSDRIWRTWSFQITSEWKLYLMRNHPKYLIMYPLIKIMESAYRTSGYPTILRRII